MKPDGVFLSNGPGDPAATGKYAVPVIQKVIDSGTPTFGICLGHQMLGLAVGAKTRRCIRAITAPIIRSRTRPPARSRSPR
jgi:carbamoyl-phosphate synthase small subunit